MNPRKAKEVILSEAGLNDASPVAARPGDASDARPRILITPEIARMVDEALDAMVKARAGIYVHARRLAIVAHDQAGTQIVELTGAWLPAVLSTLAVFVIERSSGTQAVKPPRDLVDAIVAKGSWPFPVLDGLCSSPVLRPDGTVLEKPGYDSGSRLYYAPTLEYPRVPEAPTLDDARRSLALLNEPLAEFPFVAPSDRSAALALMLSVVARPQIDGPVPLTVVRSNMPGSGKGVLVDTCSAAALGSRPARLTQPRSEEEETKQLLALGLEGARLALIDNVDRVIDSSVLAAATTSIRFKGRRLGRSQMIEVAIPVLVATGNNVGFGGDMGRRVILCDLSILSERPEERSDFRLDLPTWAIREHPRLVVAALTVLRAYVVAGRPHQGLPAFGSFESWSSLVRSALVWAGEPDPWLGSMRIRAEADVELSELQVALATWRRTFGGTAKTSAEVLEEGDHELRTALASISRVDVHELDARRLGNALRRSQRRVVGRLMFDRSGENRDKVALWRVAEIEEARQTPQDPARPRSDPAQSSHGRAEACDTSAGSAGTFSQSYTREKDAYSPTRIGPGDIDPATPQTPRLPPKPLTERPRSAGTPAGTALPSAGSRHEH